MKLTDLRSRYTYIISFVVFGIIQAYLIVLSGYLVVRAFTSPATEAFDTDSPGEFAKSFFSSSSAGIIITVLIMFAIVIAAFIYYIITLGKTGQTPGKKIMGVKVVDNDSGQPIGAGRAFLRYLVQYLSNIVCYAGLWSAWLDGPPEGRYRGWHDKAVNSVVISVK